MKYKVSSAAFSETFYRSLGLEPGQQDHDTGCWLTDRDGDLVLLCRDGGSLLETRVDFTDPALLYRLRTSGRRQGIGQAVGLNKHPSLSVMDCTAGLGRDAFVLAGLGCELVMVERHPVVHALLADGLSKAMSRGDTAVRDICKRMSLQHSSAHDLLAQLAAGQGPDVVYMDPMFPQRSKSAKVKKDMAGLQRVLGPDEDVLSLLELALRVAKRRVVVKRPRSSDMAWLEARLKPAFSFPGKSMQFDVFLPQP